MTPPAPATAAATGLADRAAPWLAALALHGGVAGLLALAPAHAPPPAEPAPIIVEVALLAPEPAPESPPPPPVPAPMTAPVTAAVSTPIPAPAPPPAPPRPTPAAPPAMAEAPAAPPVPAPRPMPVSKAATPQVAAPAPRIAAPPAPTDALWEGAGLANPPPVYPRSARLAGQEGRVVIRVKVAPDGTVASLHVVTPSGTDALDAAAVRAVRAWRFRPATRAGQPVAAEVDVPVTFRLRG